MQSLENRVSLFLSPGNGLALLVAAASGLLFVRSLAPVPLYDEIVIYGDLTLFGSYYDAFTKPILVDSGFRPVTRLHLLFFRDLDTIIDPGGVQQVMLLGIHVGNYLMHAANTLLVYFLTMRLLAPMPYATAGAVFSAAWFGFHPVHTECVAWGGGATDLLVSFFWLSATALGAHFARSRKAAAALGCAVAMTLALLTKENALLQAITLPAFIWACGTGDDDPARSGRSAAWLFGIALAAIAAYTAVRATFFRFSLPFNAPQDPPSAADIAGLVLLYVAKTFVPWPVSPYIAELPGLAYMLAVVTGLAVLALIVVFVRVPGRIVVLGSLWIGLTVLPGLIYILRPAGNVIATERSLYVPTIGAAFLLGAVVAALAARLRARIPLFIVAGVILGMFAITSFMQSAVYRSGTAFWTAASQSWGGQRDTYVLGSLGDGLYNDGRYEEAVRVLEKAVNFEDRQRWQPYQQRNLAIQVTYLLALSLARVAEQALREGRAMHALEAARKATVTLMRAPASPAVLNDAYSHFVAGFAHYQSGEAWRAVGSSRANAEYVKALAGFESARARGMGDAELTRLIAACGLRVKGS